MYLTSYLRWSRAPQTVTKRVATQRIEVANRTVYFRTLFLINITYHHNILLAFLQQTPIICGLSLSDETLINHLSQRRQRGLCFTEPYKYSHRLIEIGAVSRAIRQLSPGTNMCYQRSAPYGQAQNTAPKHWSSGDAKSVNKAPKPRRLSKQIRLFCIRVEGLHEQRTG